MTPLAIKKSQGRGIGDQGEKRAAAYLQALGYVILDRQVRFKWGEIDLVAQKGGELHFIEVKTRRTGLFGKGFESVRFTKQRRLALASLSYLSDKPKMEKLSKHFSVISIDGPEGAPVITFLKDAFEMDSRLAY